MGELGAQLEGLARAVAGTGPVPEGFDRRRVLVVRGQLLRKRARLVARSWPGLAAELGDGFADLVVPVLASRSFDRESEPFEAGRVVAERLHREHCLGPLGAEELAKARRGRLRRAFRRAASRLRRTAGRPWLDA